MQDDIFLWNWKVYNFSTNFFWFEVSAEGVFGYRMSHHPEFVEWDKNIVMERLHEWVKYTSREELFGPLLSEVPPVILKIRTMEQRHKRHTERKLSHA